MQWFFFEYAMLNIGRQLLAVCYETPRRECQSARAIRVCKCVSVCVGAKSYGTWTDARWCALDMTMQ